MKKFVVCWLCLCIVMAITGALSEDLSTASQAMTLFRGEQSGVAFALPGFGERLTDVDKPGYWRNSIQLAGACAEDGAEYQFRSADINEWQSTYAAVHQDAKTYNILAQTLYAYSSLILKSYGAETGRVKAKPVDEDTLILTYSFTYPDTPDMTYQAKCIVNEGRAYCLTMADCGHTQQVMDALHLTEGTPETDETQYVMDIAGLEAVYPTEPYEQEYESSVIYASFSQDWSYLSVQYIPAKLTLPEDEGKLWEQMMTLANDKILPTFGGEEIKSPRLFSLGDGYMLSFTSVSTVHLAQYGQPWLCRLYVSSGGVWYVTAADTEEGATFMSYLRMKGEDVKEVTRSSAVVESSETVVSNESVSFDAFRNSFSELIAAKDFGVSLDQAYWSEPFFSDGYWKRIIFSTQYSDLPFLIVCLDGPEDDALIGEVRVLGIDPTVRYADTAILASCAMEALVGDSVHAILRARLPGRVSGDMPEERYGAYLWKQSYFSSEYTEEKHHLITLGLTDDYTVRQAIIPKEGELPDITDSGVTAEELTARINRLSRDFYSNMLKASLVEIPGENEQPAQWVISVNNSFLLKPSTIDGLPTSPVRQVWIVSTEGDAPMTMACTLLTYAAMTNLSNEEFMALTYTLFEYPLWNDLAGMAPLAARNGVMAVLSDDERDGEPLFMGWVAGTAQ